MIVYHATKNENVAKIKQEGLIVNPPNNGFTYEDFWKTIKRVYGIVPIHVTLNKNKASLYSSHNGQWGYTRLTINLPDSYKNHMRADLGHLVELGAYIEEDEIYFMSRGVPKEIREKSFTPDDLKNGEIDTDLYTRLTGTACIMANIPPEYIT